MVVTVDGAAQTMYLDGQQVGTITNLSTTPLQGAPRVGDGWIDGSWPSSPSSSPNTVVSFPFWGILDELAIYDWPLSAAEVAAHHQAGTTAAPHKLTKITLPSGRVWANNTYDSATDRLAVHAGDSGMYPASRIHITAGHHRTQEIANRVLSGRMNANTLIEVVIRK